MALILHRIITFVAVCLLVKTTIALPVSDTVPPTCDESLLSESDIGSNIGARRVANVNHMS
ncbi:hypothetical protein D9757_010654 [Collybiopsis confluens]|uniref:Uncharacterized protein n=1 Tax=Collybiopsis confluens TaxID=2823264 RepID=A0A8H5GMC9_9AGAR|nr:hypothetical protein D9757_010654 [Collybiopsis confluens]